MTSLDGDIDQLLKYLRMLRQVASDVDGDQSAATWSPQRGDNDGRVRAGDTVIADCHGHEARTEYLALLHNSLPRLEQEIRLLRDERERHLATITELRDALLSLQPIIADALAIGTNLDEEGQP